MKHISSIVALLLLSFTTYAQTINVHKKNGEIIKYQSEDVDYVDFSEEEEEEEEPVGPVGPVVQSVLFDAKNALVTDFGVFGYYTENISYNPNTSKPNYMFNQQVKKTGNSSEAVWQYAPIKCWPTEYASYELAERDRLTFFAYAPWTEVVPNTGEVLNDAGTGILGMSSNSSLGDPLVKYAVSFNPEQSVDLTWGVANPNSVYTGSFAPDKPYRNLLQASSPDYLDFAFNHSLASLNVTVNLNMDQLSSGLGNNTRVWIRSITFEGFTDQGTLNLNSTGADGPRWMNAEGTDALPTTPIAIYDGRKNGSEGVKGAIATNEKTLGLNPRIIQSLPYENPYDDTKGLTTGDDNVTGVTGAKVNLFASDDADKPIYVIPNGCELSFKIEYDIETCDENLSDLLSDQATHGAKVTNVITKKISGLKLEAGYEYELNIYLGLTNVKAIITKSTWSNGNNVTR